MSCPTRSTSQTTDTVPRTVVLALGSNLGLRRYNLLRAVDSIGKAMTVVRVSSIHESAAVDAPSGSPRFLNLVLSGHTSSTASLLLRELLAIETRLGRRRAGVRNEPRIIDIDLILFSAELRSSTFLTLPHPRYLQREFVMQPLREIAEGWIDPVSGRRLGSFRMALRRD